MPAISKWIIEKNNLTKFLDAVARDTLLIAPVREEEGIVLYRPVKSSRSVSLDYVNSTVSPKEYFFPRTEKMFFFSTGENELTITENGQSTQTVLFGVRPCDLKAILSLDPVFGGEFPDTYYTGKRDSVTIIAMACENPSSRCFCTTFGFGPADGEGSDILIGPLETNYVVELLTPKGNELINSYKEMFIPDNSGKVQSMKEKAAAALAGKINKIDLAGVKELLDNNFELPYWESIASRCLNCGICTYICPTCHCFNIFDQTKGSPGGVRCRGWDSCMFGKFTLMAGGHNPRPGKKERVRNRFMHKLKYHQDRYGLWGCVGCGRCVGACPVNIDIRQIINDLREEGYNG